jgi:FKBP-type peptidyl-prolyl cis-trans isomerase FkpA
MTSMPLLMNRRSALLPLLVVLAGCLGDEAITDPKDLTFSPELGVNLSAMTLNPSGLYWQDQAVGTGPVVATVGSSVTVDYTGWLHTGRQFDSSAGKPPFTILSLGSGEVIPGWDEGLMGMRAGGRRLLVIPPHLAYGSSSAGIIPPYATLVFRVDMKSVAAR